MTQGSRCRISVPATAITESSSSQLEVEVDPRFFIQTRAAFHSDTGSRYHSHTGSMLLEGTGSLGPARLRVGPGSESRNLVSRAAFDLQVLPVAVWAACGQQAISYWQATMMSQAAAASRDWQSRRPVASEYRSSELHLH